MVNDTRLILTEEQIARNPAVDPKVVGEAERARKELETLGIWVETGSRVRNPFEIKQDPKPHGQKITQLMAQS